MTFACGSTEAAQLRRRLTMDAADEIPQLVRPQKKPGVDGEAQAVAVTKVLDDDNLLREIIVRVGFPTTLVRAALVCKRWLAHASDRKLLSRFRKLHKPRLLGYYINEISVRSERLNVTRFVPMLPQPPELATAIRLAESYSFGAHGGHLITDCRSGSILTRRCEGVSTHVVHRPLCPETSMDIVPQLPSVQDHTTKKYGAILSKDEGSGLSYFYVLGESTNEAGKSTARVYMLQDGVWHMLTSATCLHGLHFGPKALAVDNKIYLPVASGAEIIVLDLTSSSFSTIQLPLGVHYHYFKTMLSRADDASSVYLIHIEKFQLQVWLYNAGNWLLVDTICLHEMLGILWMAYPSTIGDQALANVQLVQVGDNGQFVFLRMGAYILYLDIPSRTPCRVYENGVNDRSCGSIHPLMSVWPPTFPSLMDDPARNAM